LAGADIGGVSMNIVSSLTQPNSFFSGGSGIINNQNPLFVNENDPDGPDDIFGTSDDGLVLLSNSPAIDNGIATGGAAAADLLGNPRPQGNNYDMGAYEFMVNNCLAPSNMASANISTISADLNWTAGSTDTTWNIEWKANTDFIPNTNGEDSDTTISGNPYVNITNLAANTTYYVYYQAKCDSVSSSDWVGPFVFTTLPLSSSKTMIVPSVHVCLNDTASVPVEINNGDGIVAISLKIEFDTSVVTYLQPSNIDSLLSLGNLVLTNPAVANSTGEIVISWFNLTNINFGSTTLLDLDFVGKAAGISSLTWDTTGSNCQIVNDLGAIYPFSYISGDIETHTNCAVMGQFVYGNSGTVLKNFVATLKDNTGAAIATANVGNDGIFSFYNVPNGSNYYITAELSSKPHGGINSTDAYLMAQHFIGMMPLPIGVFTDAGNVTDMDTMTTVAPIFSVNAADALATLNRFAGNTQTFVAGNWVSEYDGFSSGKARFDVSNQDVNLGEIKVLSFGDVNGSYDVSNLNNGFKSNVELTLDGEVIAQEGEMIEIPFYIDQDLSVNAISMVINYPYDVFDLEDIELNIETNNIKYTVENGRIRLGWFDLQTVNLSKGELLLTLKGKVKSDLSQARNWTPTITFGNETELADNLGIAIQEVRLSSPQIIIPDEIINEPTSNLIHQRLFPNPTSGNIQLEYDLMVDGQVKIELYDLLGRQLMICLDDYQASGFYQVPIQLEQSLSEGIYQVVTTVKTDHATFRVVEKVVVIR
jgi:hypothetical protein